MKPGSKYKVFSIILLIGIILVSGCAQYGTQSTTPTKTTQTASSGEVKEFTIEGSEYSLEPASITVNQGDRVRITFRNVGAAGHNFVIGDLGVSTNVIPGGSTETIEFTAEQSGTFDFYCSVPGHRSAGMEGEIVIS